MHLTVVFCCFCQNLLPSVWSKRTADQIPLAYSNLWQKKIIAFAYFVEQFIYFADE